MLWLLDQLRAAQEQIAALTPSDVTADECALAVFVLRQIRRGQSYDAQAGIWWDSASKPGVLATAEARIAELESALSAQASSGATVTTRTESWAVSVERNGEQVVTLSNRGISGRDLSAADEHVIREAARHLLSFIGDAQPSSSFPARTPDVDSAQVRVQCRKCAAFTFVREGYSLDAIAGWCFDTDNGWRCPACSD